MGPSVVFNLVIWKILLRRGLWKRNLKEMRKRWCRYPNGEFQALGRASAKVLGQECAWSSEKQPGGQCGWQDEWACQLWRGDRIDGRGLWLFSWKRWNPWRFLSRGNVVWHIFKESHSLHTCMSSECHLLWGMCRQRQGPGNPFPQLPANTQTQQGLDPRAGFPPVFLPLSHSLYRGEGSRVSTCLWLNSQSLSKLMMQRKLAGWVNQWALFGNISQETCSLLPSVEG